jgi:hypothetical protein
MIPKWSNVNELLADPFQCFILTHLKNAGSGGLLGFLIYAPKKYFVGDNLKNILSNFLSNDLYNIFRLGF